uniref:Peptidase A1 domain-containing protein n=1 Tax=Lactuca sativa TaxID=4236 RepID=A0A9R1XWY3_LACSA|nr:hypothetical protein LSAT_V11C100041410 [Lactuca sativa]
MFCILYYTKIKLGFPVKEYYLVIDTGSDLLLVGCKPYQSCPTSSTLQQNRQHLLLSYARTKDVLQNPTHVQITNAPTISNMEMVVEHQVMLYPT